MSDKLAPLIERQGPWLIQIGSTNEDPACWAAYIKLSDETREYLRKIHRTVEQLHADNPKGFRSVNYWSVGDIRFIEQGISNQSDLEEFAEELLSGNVEELLVPDHLIEKFDALETLRTDADLIHCSVDGVYWSACDHYSGVVYNTNTLAWEDI